jgi:hypothetical protein
MTTIITGRAARIFRPPSQIWEIVLDAMST